MYFVPYSRKQQYFIFGDNQQMGVLYQEILTALLMLLCLCWNYSCRWVIQALLSDRQYHFYGSVRSVPEALYTGISTVLSVSPVLCNYGASCI